MNSVNNIMLLLYIVIQFKRCRVSDSITVFCNIFYRMNIDALNATITRL